MIAAKYRSSSGILNNNIKYPHVGLQVNMLCIENVDGFNISARSFIQGNLHHVYIWNLKDEN